MASGDHVIDIIIETSDRTGGGLKSAQEKLLRFDQAVQRTQVRMRQMANQTFRVTLDAIDRVTPQGTKINSFLRGITGRAYRFTVGIIDRTTSGIRSLESRLGRLTAKAYNVTMNLRGSAARGLRNMADSALGAATGMTMNMAAGAGIGYGIYDTVQTYKNFEQQMSTVGAIRGLDSSSEAMQALTAKAKEMGATTVFSATQAGKAFEYMAMAGWDTDQMMGGIEGIMNLAAASGEDLGRVSDIVTDALTAFGMEASESGRFADVLAMAASNSNTNVGMMGETFQYVAPLAGALKYSIEDVALATGLMANAGIKGEKAGTSLRYTFTQLLDPPKDAAEALDNMGVSLKNADGSMRPLRSVLTDLRAGFAKMTDAEKAENAEKIAGVHAMSGFLAMMNASEESVNKMTEAVDNASGAAERMAKLRLDNLSGDLTLLSSAWESLQLSLMEGKGADGLRAFVQGVRADVEKLHGYIEKGFGIKEAGQFALDIIGQLTRKFMELDGIGSILAGGALAAGLFKIANLSRKAIGALRAAGEGPLGGAMAPGGGMGGFGGALSSMTVNANSVIVNGGSVAGGSKVLMPDGKPYPGKGGQAPNTPPQQQPTPAGGMNTWGKGWGIGGAVVGGVIGYANYQSTQDYNAQMLEEADWNIHEAGKLDEHGQVDEAALAEALDYKARVQAQNFEREVVAGSEAIGGAIGAGVGAYLGGPAGMAVGEMIGSTAGKVFGKYYLVERPDVMKNEMYETGGVDGPAVNEWKNDETDRYYYDAETGTLSGGPDSVTKDFSQEEMDAWEPIDEVTVEQTEAAWAALWGGMVETSSENIAAIQEEMQSMDEDNAAITAAMGQAWDNLGTQIRDGAMENHAAIQADFTDPVAADNDAATARIDAAWSGLWGSIKGVFAGAADWFSANVVNPIADKFSSLSLSMGGGSSEGEATPHATGGFFNSPHLGLVAEAGPEAIIPLSANQRDRAIGIFEQVAPMLGFDSVDDAEGAVTSMTSSVGGGGGTPAITINLGGLSQTITLNGEDASSVDAIKTYLTENMEQLADQLSGMIGEKVNDIWNNQPLVTG